MKIEGSTIDDVLRIALGEILKANHLVTSSRGDNYEVLAVQIELTNPRARLCFAEERQTIFGCFGEFLWYLSQGDAIEFIEYYLPKYRAFATIDHNRVIGAYGPRLFAWNDVDQVANIVGLLRERPNTKRAVIQLFDRTDFYELDVPCTCTLQFLRRNGFLHVIANMRSNDVLIGLPHDIFAFTMLQEMVACALDDEVGTYHHWVGSLHLYKKHKEKAQSLIDEGWQQTVNAAMPSMPSGDPRPALEKIKAAERAFRIDHRLDPWPTVGQKYWDEIITLLEFFRHLKDRDQSRANESMSRIKTGYFAPLAEFRLEHYQ